MASSEPRFDVVIGNPPYQEDAVGASTRAEPIYHRFMDAAYEVADIAVLITPARFLTKSGQTPRWWNRKMLDDTHLKVAGHYPVSADVFSGPDIKGGIAITYRDANRKIGPIGTFTTKDEVASIWKNIEDHEGFVSLSTIVSSQGIYRFSDLAMANEPRIAAVQGQGTGSKITSSSMAALVGDVFFTQRPDGDYVELIGVERGQRVRRWIRRDYLNKVDSLDKWKVIIANANNSGAFGETLANPFVGEPGLGHTDTFMTVGEYDTEAEAEACLKFLKTKTARAMLSILKTTQHNSKAKWRHVPLLDFRQGHGIDWSGSVAEIDQQLYRRYAFSPDEIEFIEANVKAMDEQKPRLTVGEALRAEKDPTHPRHDEAVQKIAELNEQLRPAITEFLTTQNRMLQQAAANFPAASFSSVLPSIPKIALDINSYFPKADFSVFNAAIASVQSSQSVVSALQTAAKNIVPSTVQFPQKFLSQLSESIKLARPNFTAVNESLISAFNLSGFSALEENFTEPLSAIANIYSGDFNLAEDLPEYEALANEVAAEVALAFEGGNAPDIDTTSSTKDSQRKALVTAIAILVTGYLLIFELVNPELHLLLIGTPLNLMSFWAIIWKLSQKLENK